MIWSTVWIEAVVFTALFTYGAILAGADSFWTGAEFAAILFLIVGAWDTFFLDWVLFAHLKVFRLPGTEHMDKAYAQKWFHVKGMLFPGLAVSRHYQRAHGPSCDVGQVSKKEKIHVVF